MTKPTDAASAFQPDEPHGASGRYRFQAGRPLDPDAGVHPEMLSGSTAELHGAGIPSTPQELIAMQDSKPQRPEKPEHQRSAKVTQVLDLIEQLETSAAEDQQIAATLVRRLETFHDNVVREMQDDDDARHSQIVSWAIDADRLYRCRKLLESVDLE